MTARKETTLGDDASRRGLQKEMMTVEGDESKR